MLRKKVLLAFTLLAILAACAPRTPQVRTTGTLRILSIQPDVESGCTVRAGDWMALKGNDFGKPADWETDGPNSLVFPPGAIAAESIELTRTHEPATLFFMVPAAAESGLLRLHVQGVGDAEITVNVSHGPAPQLAVPGCALPSPPAVSE